MELNNSNIEFLDEMKKLFVNYNNEILYSYNDFKSLEEEHESFVNIQMSKHLIFLKLTNYLFEIYKFNFDNSMYIYNKIIDINNNEEIFIKVVIDYLTNLLKDCNYKIYVANSKYV